MDSTSHAVICMYVVCCLLIGEINIIIYQLVGEVGVGEVDEASRREGIHHLTDRHLHRALIQLIITQIQRQR